MTVRERLQRDPSFREALLEEAVDWLLASDVEAGKSLLRDYVNAPIGWCWPIHPSESFDYVLAKPSLRVIQPS